MKKLMIALSAIAIAVGAEATAVSWNTGSFYLPGAGGNGYGDSAISFLDTGYTVAISFFADEACTSALWNDGDAGGSKVVPKTSILGDADLYVSEGGAGISAGTAYYTKAVVTRESDGATLESQIMKFILDSGTMDDPYMNFMETEGAALATWESTNGTFSEDYGYWSASGWTTAAPEPTSGLLLLIGVAGLALRRKQK